MFTITARAGKARAGILKTKTSEVKTPAFMPVNTKAAAKFVTVRDLVEMDVQAIICNAFILYLKPGLSRAGDIHEFMGFKRSIFTDCGSFSCTASALSRDCLALSTLSGTSEADGSVRARSYA